MTHFILMVLCEQFSGIYLMRLKTSLSSRCVGKDTQNILAKMLKTHSSVGWLFVCKEPILDSILWLFNTNTPFQKLNIYFHFFL